MRTEPVRMGRDGRDMDLNEHLRQQLAWHWEQQARPRLDGLTDDEHLWEPAQPSWSIRPRAEARTSIQGGSGPLVAEFELPEPDPTPVTTIAWRLGHLIVGVFGARNAAHFGGPPMDYMTMVWPATAKEAVAMLDEGYERWMAGVASLGEDGLQRPCGPAEGPYADEPMLSLVLHIHREAIHHLAEIALLRDLYRCR